MTGRPAGALMQTVEGYCPMGCGQTLFLGEGGRITCSWIECPRPAAVDELLADHETEHVVTIGLRSFAVQHPLRERLDGELHRCELHQELSAADGPPAKPGRYRAVRKADPDSEALGSVTLGNWALEAMGGSDGECDRG